MKQRLLLLLTLLAASLPLAAQDIKLSYDEECGCDLFFVDGIETTRDGEFYGFRREDGTVIAPNIYRFVDQFHDGYCRVMLNDTLVGLIDSTGRQVVPCIYQNVEYPSEGRVLVYRNGVFGYTDLDGNLVIPFRFLAAGNFSEGCANVYMPVDSTYAACSFIDTAGNLLFPLQFENVQPFSCGYALVRQYDRWGVIDHSGRVVLHTMFENMTTLFGDTLFFAGDPDGMALYDVKMKPLTKPVYTWTGGMQDGRIAVQRDGKYGFLDRYGHEVIPCIYDETSLFDLARAMVRVGDRYGIVDTSGNYILPLEYERSSMKAKYYVYHDSLALVQKDGKMGYVDIHGHFVIPCLFSDAYQFSEGLAAVLHNGRWGYIDTKGDIFLPFIFDLASPYQWGRAEVIYNDELRNVDRRGRCVKNCKGIIAWRDWTE